MKQIPADYVAYKQTPVFTETTVPAGLLKRHKTKVGIWGKIVVLEGRLMYRILEPVLETHELNPTQAGAVEPTVAHEVAPLGPVKFYVEFFNGA